MSVRRLLKLVAVAFLGVSAISVGACASGARSAQMTVSAATVTPVQAGEPGYRAFKVTEVSGGSDTNPLWMSNVSTAQFKAALEGSLQAAGHLADPPETATHEISAQMLGLDRPAMGLDLTVESLVRYKATPIAGGSPVVDEQVNASGKAKFGDSLLAVERLRLANEAAIRVNIEQFIALLRERLKTAPAAAAGD